jgi:hypothetical protein
MSAYDTGTRVFYVIAAGITSPPGESPKCRWFAAES